MSTVEHLYPIPNPWEQVVHEMLSGKEYTQENFDVYPLVGRLSSGKVTIRGLLTEWLERDGYAVEFSSTGEQVRQHQLTHTGKRRMTGHYPRPGEVDKQLDLETAAWMIDPNNKGKILIPVGRTLGYSAGKLNEAATKLGLVLPSNIHPVLLTAEKGIRFDREYEKLHADDPTITHLQAFSETLERESGEDALFPNIYPDLLGKDLYNPNLTITPGAKIYEAVFDTSEHSAGFTATKIYEFIKETAVSQPQLLR